MVPGADKDCVKTSWEVLEHPEEVGSRVVIIDEEGHHQAVSIAEFLKDMDRDVEIVTHMPTIAADLLIPSETQVLYPRLLKKGIRFTPNAAIREIGDDQVVFNTYTGEAYVIENVNTVVLIVGRKPDTALAEEIRGQVPELYEIGDCYSPRKVNHAIYEGFMTAMKI